MKKGQIKALIGMGLMAFPLGYMGMLAHTRGLGLAFWGLIGPCALLAGPLLVYYYRQFSAYSAWVVAMIFGGMLVYGTRDLATGILISVLCLGGPLAITFFWSHFQSIDALTRMALPAAGLLQFAGTLLYCRLHFGVWSLQPMITRIAEKLVRWLQEFQDLQARVYTGETLTKMQETVSSLIAQADTLSFLMVLMVVYGLLGQFFLSVFWADRAAMRDGHLRWSGDWKTLIPGKWISFGFAGLYLLGSLLQDPYYWTLYGVLNLYGFFYVFAAVYWLLQYLRKKGVPQAARGFLCGLLLVLSYLTVGGSLLSAYVILMALGWGIAVSPVRAGKEGGFFRL